MKWVAIQLNSDQIDDWWMMYDRIWRDLSLQLILKNQSTSIQLVSTINRIITIIVEPVPVTFKTLQIDRSFFFSFFSVPFDGIQLSVHFQLLKKPNLTQNEGVTLINTTISSPRGVILCTDTDISSTAGGSNSGGSRKSSKEEKRHHSPHYTMKT